MNEHDIHPIMAALRRAVTTWQTPIVDEMAQQAATPYTILITTILSLRTQDGTTAAAARRLFELAQTPATMLEVPAATVAQAIYPVGFYKTKAETILTVSRLLIERYGGAVPDTVEELLTLPGVGRKTANLVVTMGYNKPGICVDTHVHRITNRWGYVQTKTPEQTEFALRARLPAEYWIPINGYLVSLGQNICHPTSPRCSQCPIAAWCDRIGVTRSR